MKGEDYINITQQNQILPPAEPRSRPAPRLIFSDDQPLHAGKKIF